MTHDNDWLGASCGNDNAAELQNDSLPAEGTHSQYHVKMGIYGWRKRCLYVLILGLIAMVVINLALILWIMKVMVFSSEGLGNLRIIDNGLQLSGHTLVLDTLRASSIHSRYGQAISIESYGNFSVSTTDKDGLRQNSIFIGADRLECSAGGFTVTDPEGSILFSADRKEVVVGSESLRVTGEGGAIFGESVQTPHVKSESSHDLRLESPTRAINLQAPVAITVESRAGDIRATSLNDLKLQSTAGAIRIEAPSILMPGMKTAMSTMSATSQSRGRTHGIYQLCVCDNGKLFLAPPLGSCEVDDTGHVCHR